MPRSGTAASYGNSMFKCSRNHHTAFHNSCTILYSHQQHTRLQISPSPRRVNLFGKLSQVATLDTKMATKLGYSLKIRWLAPARTCFHSYSPSTWTPLPNLYTDSFFCRDALSPVAWKIPPNASSACPPLSSLPWFIRVKLLSFPGRQANLRPHHWVVTVWMCLPQTRSSSMAVSERGPQRPQGTGSVMAHWRKPLSTEWQPVYAQVKPCDGALQDLLCAPVYQAIYCPHRACCRGGGVCREGDIK